MQNQSVGLRFAVWVSDSSIKAKWLAELDPILESLTDVGLYEDVANADVILVDATIAKRHADQLKAHVASGDRLVLLGVEAEDADGMDFEKFRYLRESIVDDILVRPFKRWDLLSRFRSRDTKAQLATLRETSQRLAATVESLQTDVGLAERLQKASLPQRFDELKGIKVRSRYLAGTKAGGDFFDLAESRTGNQLSVVLTDSSTYGLSSAVLSALMSVAMKLSADEVRSCQDTIRKISHELHAVLGNRSQLSLFYATLSRKDYQLRYLNLGSAIGFHARLGKSRGFEMLPPQGAPIHRGFGLDLPEEQVLALEPSDRLVLLSDGFVQAFGGEKQVCEMLDYVQNKSPDKDPNDLLNQLVFQVKSQFATPEDLPAQDCTAIVMDVDQKILRLAG